MAKVIHIPLKEVGYKVAVRELKDELGVDNTLTVKSARAGLNRELVRGAIETEPFIALIIDGDKKTIIGSKDNATIFGMSKNGVNRIVRTAHGNYGLSIDPDCSITL